MKNSDTQNAIDKNKTGGNWLFLLIWPIFIISFGIVHLIDDARIYANGVKLKAVVSDIVYKRGHGTRKNRTVGYDELIISFSHDNQRYEIPVRKSRLSFIKKVNIGDKEAVYFDKNRNKVQIDHFTYIWEGGAIVMFGIVILAALLLILKNRLKKL
jgi:hypothetical protein